MAMGYKGKAAASMEDTSNFGQFISDDMEKYIPFVSIIDFKHTIFPFILLGIILS